MRKLGIFASGSGTNAEEIIKYFQTSDFASVKLVLSNKPDAFVLQRANKLQVPSKVFSRDDLYEGTRVINWLNEFEVDLVILAGFLWLIPDQLLDAYPQRIVNIHPALLPDFGGKGMYGHHVHEAVIAAGKKESGITIHVIDREYDKGITLHQEKCPVLPDDTPDSLAQRIHKLEHEHYPKVIEKYLHSLYR